MSPAIDLNSLVVCSICAAVVYQPEYEGHERWHQHLIDQATTGSPLADSPSQGSPSQGSSPQGPPAPA
jgi:hypothetical protein